MKRSILLITLSILFVCRGNAQELTVEYNTGYGTYRMGDMKDMLEGIRVEPPLDHLRTTDNFPGYQLHTVRVGYAWMKHQAGVLFEYLNTAGRNHLADYSGEFSGEIRVRGYKTGLFYRWSFAGVPLGDMALEPYLQFSSGITADRVKSRAYLAIGEEALVDHRETLNGSNLFVEPAAGVRLKVNRHIAVNLSAGYEWDPVSNLYAKKEGQRVKSEAGTDWSGLRLQAGLIFYVSLKR